MECPFCGEDDFDLVGLKAHLTGEGFLFAEGCQVFSDTLTIQEEKTMREIQQESSPEGKEQSRR